MLTARGGKIYWCCRNDVVEEKFGSKSDGIVVVFAWVSISESQLNEFVDLYSDLGWSCLVCVSEFLNPFFPERATSLAFSVLNELLEELRCRPRPLVLASYSGGSKACMYKVFQIIDGACEVHLNPADSRLIMTCIAGQIYDSGPVDFIGDLGARFALHPSILRMPGSSKLVSLFAKGVTSGLDALFLTKFGSQRLEYWQALHSSVGLGAPFLILCSPNDDLAPLPLICSFAQRLQELGGNVRVVKWKDSGHATHYKCYPSQYRAAVVKLLEQAVAIFSQKFQKHGERCGMEGVNDKICELICDLQNAAVDSNRSLQRVAVGPNDHFFLPSSAGYYQNGREPGSSGDEQNERTSNLSTSPPSLSAHTILGQMLFDNLVPKNVEGWDIKCSAKSYAHNQSRNPFRLIRRSRL